MAARGRSPVMVVPEDTLSLDVRGPAVVGWNGSAEAAHALRASVPLLRKAASVTLVNVAEEVEQEGAFLPLLDASEYLSRHAVACETPKSGAEPAPWARL